MSNLHTESAEDEDEEQDNEPENEKNKDMPKTNPTSDVAKRTIAPLIGNTGVLSPEDLEALKRENQWNTSKPLSVQVVARPRKSLVLQQCQVANLQANLVMNCSSKSKKRPSTLICSNFWKTTPLSALGSNIS